METALSYFENIQDPRSARNQKHPFMTLMATSLLSSLSGIDSFSGMAEFTECHYDNLRQYFDFPSGVPSHDTYQRFWSHLNPDEFYESFVEFTSYLSQENSSVISLDGKVIRNSGQSCPLHIVSAWCSTNQLVLAQEKVHKKSNEITALPKLLKLIDLKSKIVTIDAIGAQRKICAQIIEQEGDYVISLKKNQGVLYEDIKQYFESEGFLSKSCFHEQYDKGHGRIEKRQAYSTESIKWLKQEHNWPGLKSIGVVLTKVEKKGKISEEKRFYISSLPAHARQLNETVRAHWGIENKLHWRLDVVFNEDKACIRNDNAAENIDIMRKWSLNSLTRVREKPSQSLKSMMRKNSMSFKYLIQNVNNIFHA